MRMPQNSQASLWNTLSAAGDLSARFVFGAEASIALGDLVAGSALYGRGDELRGLSVLIATTNQLTAASALIELDGIARRIVLCPPDLPLELLPFVIDSADVDAIVSDRTDAWIWIIPVLYASFPAVDEITPEKCERSAQHQTEWILLTSGTTGLPKLVVHTLDELWLAQLNTAALRQTRSFGARSTTFAVTAACRYFCAPSSPGHRWCCRARRSRRRIFWLGPARTESLISPERPPIGVVR